MNRLVLCIVAGLLLAGIAFPEEPPDWAKREYAAPVTDVYGAALKSIVLQHHDVKGKKDQTIEFHVGTTAWSWGYNMELTVTPVDDTHCRVVVGILRSGGKTFSWGSGKKEVRKIFDGIDAELVEQKKATK
jgi:hypothetical protein